MRKMRIIVALAAAFALAIPAVASADAFVDSQGYGFVGKGDVQTTLGLNDAELQSLFASNPLRFGAHIVTTYDNQWSCSDGSVHPYTTVVTTNQPVSSTANTNNAGRLTSGWDLTGPIGTAHSFSVDNLPEGEWLLMCPHGTSLTDQRRNDDAYATVVTTPYVNGQLIVAEA
jgi:opacity protein-like surface antigen